MKYLMNELQEQSLRGIKFTLPGQRYDARSNNIRAIFRCVFSLKDL